LLIAVTLAAFAVAVVLGVWLANRIVGPLIRIRAAADRASRGDVANVEVATDRNDEVGDLARAIRRLLVSINVLIAKEQEPSERDQQAVG
jgi:two-component system sensor histidine kinase ChvG